MSLKMRQSDLFIYIYDSRKAKSLTLEAGLEPAFGISDFGGARNRTGIGTGLSCASELSTTLRATITPHHRQCMEKIFYFDIY